MFVTHLGLIDFRSYEAVELDLGPGVTVLVGPNGQGKTNLVEAVGYACTLASHRVATDAPLVRMGADRSVIRVQAYRGGRSVLVEIEINPGRANRARVNRTPVPRQRDVLGTLSRVLFAPEDLALVKGDPGERRSYLDELLVAMSPRFDAVISDLERILKQRNSLLRSASQLRSGGTRSRAAAEQTLTVWDEQLAARAAEVVVARAGLVSRLQRPLRERYASVAPEHGDPRATARYSSSIPGFEPGRGRDEVATLLLAALEQRRDEEFARGITLVGPHRDELALTLNEMPVKGYASHGESWSMALALRLASYDIVQADSGPGGDPILVLDDVFAELDSGRRERLAAAVAEVDQVLVTAAVPADVPTALSGRRVEVTRGAVREVGHG